MADTATVAFTRTIPRKPRRTPSQGDGWFRPLLKAAVETLSRPVIANPTLDRRSDADHLMIRADGTPDVIYLHAHGTGDLEEAVEAWALEARTGKYNGLKATIILPKSRVLMAHAPLTNAELLHLTGYIFANRDAWNQASSLQGDDKVLPDDPLAAMQSPQLNWHSVAKSVLGAIKVPPWVKISIKDGQPNHDRIIDDAIHVSAMLRPRFYNLMYEEMRRHGGPHTVFMMGGDSAGGSLTNVMFLLTKPGRFNGLLAGAVNAAGPLGPCRHKLRLRQGEWVVNAGVEDPVLNWLAGLPRAAIREAVRNMGGRWRTVPGGHTFSSHTPIGIAHHQEIGCLVERHRQQRTGPRLATQEI